MRFSTFPPQIGGTVWPTIAATDRLSGLPQGQADGIIQKFARRATVRDRYCSIFIPTAEGSAKLVDHKLVQDLKALVETILADPDVTISEEDKAAYEDDLANVFVGW